MAGRLAGATIWTNAGVLVQGIYAILGLNPPQIATVMKPMSFCSKYTPASHTKSLGESREWNMFFLGNI